MKKGFDLGGFLIVVGIIVFGGGVYYYLSTNTNTVSENTVNDLKETNDWLTYSNEKLNFSLRYPNNWRFTLSYDGGLPQFLFETGQIGQKWGSERDQFWMSINCWNDLRARPYKNKTLFKTQEPITISGHDTLLYENKNLTEYPGYEPMGFVLPIIKDDKMHCGMYLSSWGELNEEEKGIINSLKFIDGFEDFTDRVLKEFETNPPGKG